MALTGQTYSQGAVSQCWHIIGWVMVSGFAAGPEK